MPDILLKLSNKAEGTLKLVVYSPESGGLGFITWHTSSLGSSPGKQQHAHSFTATPPIALREVTGNGHPPKSRDTEEEGKKMRQSCEMKTIHQTPSQPQRAFPASSAHWAAASATISAIPCSPAPEELHLAQALGVKKLNFPELA